MIYLVTKNDTEVRLQFQGELDYGISYISNYDATYYKENYSCLRKFSSGNDILDEILHKELHRHSECHSFLFYQKDDEIPIAFCSMCCSAVNIEEQINGQVESIMHPAIEFRYFAVRKDRQNTKIRGTNTSISSYIFKKCMQYAYVVSNDVISAEYFVLHAQDSKKVRNFYKKHNFVELPTGTKIATDTTFANCVPAILSIK